MKNQVFFIEYEEFTRRRSFPPVNFKVDYLGEIMLVSDVHVAGKIISQSPKCGSFSETRLLCWYPGQPGF